MGEFRVHHVRLFEYIPQAIHCLAYDDAQQKIALSRADRSIEIWNLRENWMQEKILPPSEDRSVEALLWCQQRLFSASLYGDVHEYDLLTGQVQSSVSSNSGPVWCLTQDKKGSQIAAGTEDGCVVLFDVTESGLEYSRALDRQEGRILSIAWHGPENVVVTGGINNIRVWSASSGRAIQRLTLPRLEKDKETIVWAVAVTEDYTIISGDSTGKTCFWNGRQGTLYKSFQSHKAAILTLCVNKEGTSVFSSGIDPTLTQFEYVSSNPSSDWKMWVRSSVRVQHSHDVRTVTFVNDDVVSGGIDTTLILNQLHAKSGVQPWRRISPVSQAPLVYTAKTSHMVLFRYPKYLELWKLGSTNTTSKKNGQILQLKTTPVKLLQLKCRDNEVIISAAISHNAEWIAYSDQRKIRFFKVSIEDLDVGCPRVSVSRATFLTPGVEPANYMEFSPDSAKLVLATLKGVIQVIDCDNQQLMFTVEPPPGESTIVHILAISPSSKYLATGDMSGKVHIYNLKNKKHLVTLPHYPHLPTALSFHPRTALLVVVYTNQVIMEYNYLKQMYTDWTRKHMDKYPTSWRKGIHKVKQVMYNPQNPNQIVVRDTQSFCFVDKTQPFPPMDKQIRHGSHRNPTTHAFHLCMTFKYLLHIDILEDDFMLAVEMTPFQLEDKLPPSLKYKKFGT